MQATYGEDFYEGMVDANLESARAVVPLVFTFVQPKSVVDIGCGEGLWLKACMEKGVADIDGFDGDYVVRNNLKIPQERFHPANLEEKIPLTRTYDMAVCLEVAEHVSDKNSRLLVESLTSAAPIVLFSAAIPWQGGVHHVNEQWPQYWQERFKEKGYVPVDCLRRRLWNDSRVAFFYAQNILIYVKESELSLYPKLVEEIARGNGQIPALVHPKLYTNYAERWSLIVPLLSMFPPQLLHLGKSVAKKLIRMPLAQLFRYLVSGGIAATVYFVIIFALVEFANVHYLVASSVALAVAIGISFSLHKFFTFRERTLSRTPMQFVLYLTVVGMDFLINLSVLWLLVEKVGMPYLLGAFIATAMVAIVNFIAYRLVVFRRFSGAVSR